VLTARIVEIARDEGLTTGETVSRAIARYAAGAGDAEWMTLMGLMSRAEDPGAVLIRRSLAFDNS
jgi:hypothetical protein